MNEFIILFIGIISGAVLVYFFYKRPQETIKKVIDESQLQNYKEREKNAKILLEVREQELERVDKEIEARTNNLKETIDNEKDIVLKLLEEAKEMAAQAFSQYVDVLESYYNSTEGEFDEKMTILKTQLEEMKATQAALQEAALREQQLEEQGDFYKISISAIDLVDIEILDKIKPQIRKPEILSKLIWTTYYQKPLNTLCNNVLSDKMITGIYKITDSTTGLCYIGQSVNVANRWKEHVKAALGAGTSTSDNKLYNAMREHGVHNFTFELLEAVAVEDLNKAEKKYIDFYQSNIYGLNSVKGVSK